MAERPRTGSSVPPDPEASEGSDKKKKGDSESSFPLPMNMRSTMMGLAPAPHLGGLAGSPGAIARAEAEARRQRVMERLQDKQQEKPGSAMTGPPPPPSSHPREELIEPVPGTGPPPAPRASFQPPAFGTTTMLMTPSTPDVPLTLPKATPEAFYNSKLPSSDGWEVAKPNESASDDPGAGTVLLEPRQGTAPLQRPIEIENKSAAGPAHVQAQARHDGPIEHARTTQRMLRPATPANLRPSQPPPANLRPSQPPPANLRPSQPPPANLRPSQPPPANLRPSQPPPPAMVLRRWEPQEPPPPVPLPHDKRLVLIAEPDSPAADGYRVLRDGLIAKNLPRVLAVSSPLQKDGKTTCAINLALALAEQPSTRVLLVDANFFEPELAQIFKLEQLPAIVPPEAETWLSPYRLVQVTPNLHLSAILRSEVPRRRFDQHRFEALIDRFCRANYDYIVMDAPALHGSPAVGQLVSIADATLLAVRAGAGTTARELRRVADQIPKDKAFGVALIDG